LLGGGFLRCSGRHDSLITPEECSKLWPLENLLDFIENTECQESTKTTYRSYVKSLYQFLTKDLYKTPSLFAKKNTLSLYDAEKLFEFLETRALKSTAIRAFEDILICRALLYLPLPAKKMFSLETKKKNCLI
jgi:hypothetical protein